MQSLIVTTALPYANGDLHLGHILEHIQSNIWSRTQKMLGVNCVSICGIDAHGTPIMLKAQELNISPEELTKEVKQSHEKDFANFLIEYDEYHTTHSKENEALARDIFLRLKNNNAILIKNIKQAFDQSKGMFLPDRFIKGTCPKCRAQDQYGDNCEQCGAAYPSSDLLNPVSVLSGQPPIEKESEHYFFDLPKYEAFLKNYLQTVNIQSEIANKLKEWFDAGLKPWDISRDAPYFGFLIPDTSDKYFYVWLDAPIGYMASHLKYCQTQKLNFADFWDKTSDTKLYHFIGKDIVYFHALFWPAMLKSAGFRKPSGIFAHGFLTINGQKMSKSRGTFISAKQYLQYLDPEYLRFYFAAKLNNRIDDVDINWEEFITRVNSDLVGKIVNIASRSAGFIAKYFDNVLADTLESSAIYQDILNSKAKIIDLYLARDYAQAVRVILECADKVNQYIDAKKPWNLIKDKSQEKRVHEICSTGLNLFRLIIGYLKPILPKMAKEAEEFLNCAELTFANLDNVLLNHKINTFKPLMVRVSKDNVDALLNHA